MNHNSMDQSTQLHRPGLSAPNTWHPGGSATDGAVGRRPVHAIYLAARKVERPGCAAVFSQVVQSASMIYFITHNLHGLEDVTSQPILCLLCVFAAP